MHLVDVSKRQHTSSKLLRWCQLLRIKLNILTSFRRWQKILREDTFQWQICKNVQQKHNSMRLQRIQRASQEKHINKY